MRGTEAAVSCGTLSFSWGRYGGFYATFYPRTKLAPRRYARLCLGWVAFTYIPIEIDDLMRGYLDAREAQAGAEAPVSLTTGDNQSGS